MKGFLQIFSSSRFVDTISRPCSYFPNRYSVHRYYCLISPIVCPFSLLLDQNAPVSVSPLPPAFHVPSRVCLLSSLFYCYAEPVPLHLHPAHTSHPNAEHVRYSSQTPTVIIQRSDWSMASRRLFSAINCPYRCVGVVFRLI